MKSLKSLKTLALVAALAASGISSAASASTVIVAADGTGTGVTVPVCAKAQMDASEKYFWSTTPGAVNAIAVAALAHPDRCFERLGVKGNSGYALGDVAITHLQHYHSAGMFDVSVLGRQIGVAMRLTRVKVVGHI